jgi:hypothetical protein
MKGENIWILTGTEEGIVPSKGYRDGRRDGDRDRDRERDRDRVRNSDSARVMEWKNAV